MNICKCNRCLAAQPKISRYVLFFSGGLQYFRGEHLKYAIPAIAILFALLIPPLFLIAYPLSCKILGFCNLSESGIVDRLTRLIPIQLLDSFQSCFKDNLRFFAGFYFYTLVELQVLLFLVIHAVVQPYKKRWHNIVNALMFADLAIINGLTLYNFVQVTGRNDNEEATKSFIKGSSIVQLILSSLPLMYMASYILFRIHTKFSDTRENTDDYDSLPSLRDPQEPLLVPRLRRRLQQPGYHSIRNNTH